MANNHFRTRNRSERSHIATAPEESEFWAESERAGVGIFEYYPQSGEVQVSSTTRKNLGLSQNAEINYRVFLTALHPDDRERVDREIAAVLDRNNDAELTAEFRTVGIEDRKERRVELHGEAYFNRYGAAVLFSGRIKNVSRA